MVDYVSVGAISVGDPNVNPKTCDTKKLSENFNGVSAMLETVKAVHFIKASVSERKTTFDITYYVGLRFNPLIQNNFIAIEKLVNANIATPTVTASNVKNLQIKSLHYR